MHINAHKIMVIYPLAVLNMYCQYRLCARARAIFLISDTKTISTAISLLGTNDELSESNKTFC